MMNIDLSGKAAVVTGGGSGIGEAIALQLADCGARIWIGDISPERADGVCSKIKEAGGEAGYTKTDVSKPDDVKAMLADAKAAYGRIDIAVNSAGLFQAGGMFDVEPEKVQAHLNVNLNGIIYSTRYALEIMIEQGGGGKIVNLASVGGRLGELISPYYSLGKSGIINFTQSAAFTAAPHGINVNSLCPGNVRTPMWDVILDDFAAGDPSIDRDELFMEISKSRAPLGRPITTQEVAYAACFLCSEYSDAIVGQALNVCGGWRMN